MANLEEGELEDGELLSSDEEPDQGADSQQHKQESKETTFKPQIASIPKLLELDVKQPVDTNNTNHSSARSPDAEKTADTNLNKTEGSEDGEIFSDDEEAAYYPQHVKSRPQPKEKKALNDAIKPSDTDSQKSDTESPSSIRSGRRSRDRHERERNLRTSPESESDSTHQNRKQASDSKEQGLFFEDRDGSETESTSSRERTRSRSRERERDRRSSPKYGGGRNRNRERDRDFDRGNRTRNDDDSSDDKEQQYRSSGSSTYYGRQSGGYGGRTRGGYGGYQQRGSYGASKFQVGGVSGGGGGGGYTSSIQPGLMNTGMTAQQFHALAAKVKKRREDGLPLLPQPNLDKCGNLDQYNYPAPPSWYLEELEAWEKREKDREEEEMTKKEATVIESTEQAPKPLANLKESEERKTEVIVAERKRPISPLFRRTSSVALEIVSSPVSDDGEPTLAVIEGESEPEDKNTETVSPELTKDTQPETEEPMETAVSSTDSDASAVAKDSDISTVAGVRPLKELAAIVVQASSTKPTSPTATATMATAAIATPVMTVSATTETIATTTTAITTAATESASQSLPDPSTSTAMPSQSPVPTSDSTHLPEEAPPTKPTPAPLTISTEPVEMDSDHSHSPSLSPTIPIQSGSQTKGASSLRPKGVFRPKIMSDSDSEGDYDDYLDQLDEEEDDVTDTKNNTSLLANTLSEGFPLIGGSSASSLTSLFEAGGKPEEATNQVLGSIGDPFSEDFPVIGKDTDKSSTKQNTLMSLIAVGQEVVDKDTDDNKTQGDKRSKSARRKLKDSAWWIKQKEKEKKEKAKQAANEESKRSQPCKYFLSGNCKNGDSCAYSHDCAVQKKKEICKYYIQGYCSKGELCHYYHGTFPCKYIHTKGYCKNGDQCRFSHAPLTPEAKELLITVLDPSQVAALNASLPSPNPTSTSSLVVSIPKQVVKGLIVSIPLSKLQKDYRKKLPTTPSPNVSAPSNAFPPTATHMPQPHQQQYQNQPQPRGPFPFQQQSGNPVPFLPPGGPGRYGAPPPPPPTNMQPQPVPIPLFPPKQQNQFQPQGPPPFPPPNQAPPTSGPRMPHPPAPPPPPGGPGGQRRSLLPTPPPHMMLSPDDLKRMENTDQQEYWEAPELSQQNPPHHYNQPPPPAPPPQAPPMGGAPPYNNAPPPPLPPGQPFGRGGGFPPRAQGPPPPGPGPFPPQQPYRHPPPPQQFGAPPPGQQQAPPTFRPPGPPPPPNAQWGEQRPQPGMEQRHPPPPPGMDPRHNQPGGSPFPSSRIDPRQGGPVNPPQGGIGSDPWRPANVPPDQMPPPAAPQQQQDGSRWNAPPASGPPVNAPPSFPRPPPPSHQQNPSVPPSSNVVPFQPPQQPPYQTHNAMSPPRYPMASQQQHPQVGGATQPHAPPPGMEKASRSPTWRASPEYSGSQSPSGGTVGDQARRRDPRTKYAHLKIKSKGQTSNASGPSNSQPILKRSADEAGMDVPASGFKIPKLLQDSSALNRPMDPGELFGGKDALCVGEEREQGITTPFGAFRSMFPQAPSSESEGNNAESAGSSQKFGEITMGADPLPTKANENDEAEKEKEGTSSESTNAGETKDNSKPAEVPSYLAHLNMGLGDDLKIDSAFGSLSDKSTKDGESSEKSSQVDSQARKLPSIFGFS